MHILCFSYGLIDAAQIRRIDALVDDEGPEIEVQADTAYNFNDDDDFFAQPGPSVIYDFDDSEPFGDNWAANPAEW